MPSSLNLYGTQFFTEGMRPNPDTEISTQLVNQLARNTEFIRANKSGVLHIGQLCGWGQQDSLADDHNINVNGTFEFNIELSPKTTLVGTYVTFCYGYTYAQLLGTLQIGGSDYAYHTVAPSDGTVYNYVNLDISSYGTTGYLPIGWSMVGSVNGDAEFDRAFWGLAWANFKTI